MRGVIRLLVLVGALFSGAVCADTVTVPVDNTSLSRLLLPVVKKTIPVNATITLRSEAGPVEADIYSRLLWPQTEEKRYVRLLIIDLPSPPAFSELTLTCKDSNKEIRPFWGSMGEVSLISPDIAWLQQVVKLHPFSVPGHDWYIGAQRLHANYIADDEQMKEARYPLTRASHWLYDKPQSFFQLYLLTGDDWALRQGKRLAEIYEMHIKEDGYFSLRNREDTKYIMSRGLTYHFLLTGSKKMKSAVARQFEASLEWDPEYDSWTGFWTERNQAAALNTAIAHWELTGSEEAKARIGEIVNATYEMTFEPDNDWPVRDCPQHEMDAHEGKGGDRPVCSPWMMALLADGLWRLVLLNDDRQAAELLRAFGRFFADYGAYSRQVKDKTVIAPYYLRAFPDHDWIEKNIWTDPQHNCEVAGMLGKSIMLYGSANKAPSDIKKSFSEFAASCRSKLSRLVERNIQKGPNTAVKLMPPRRFGWMYSSTAELPWLMHSILSETE